MNPVSIRSVTCLVLMLGVAGSARAEADLDARLLRARDVYQELTQATDRQIPAELRANCRCIAVLPHVVKAAVGIGGRYGKGVITCRDEHGAWSPPVFLTLTGGSWGLQLGAEATDVVLFFMNERGVRSLLQSKFTLGAKAGLAAGPVGRSAEASTDLKLNAEIYSYARSKGLFAGVSLEGARLAVDGASDEKFYGGPVLARDVLFGGHVPNRPAAADTFLQALR